ncbi:MAG: DNA alkylation repair protein [Bacteroidota bacterium]
MEPLKEMFNKKFYVELSREFEKAHAKFNSGLFLNEITENLEPLSLNERMRKTSVVLKNHLPADFKKSLDIMYKVIPNLKRGYTNLLFPDFVGLYGHQHFDLSMEALKYFTGFGSSEFAVREFLKRDFKKTIAVMTEWSKHKDAHVRRLSSEGSRPRLPWSFKLDQVIKDPGATKKILEQLKNDDELYVRKSVANHLNDISKDNPGYMLQVVGKWDQSKTNTSWIIKHASRSLIKKGNADSLSIFNFEKDVKVRIIDFNMSADKIKLGDTLQFSFGIGSLKTAPQKLVIDYIVHYQKKSGETSPKVFKLTELHLGPKQSVNINKKQVFKDFTTRKHFKGTHKLEIQINGRVFAKKEFDLLV